VRLVVGSAWGLTSPVRVFSDTIYADVALEPGAALPVDAAHEERALYTVDGEVEIAAGRFPPGQLLVLRPGDAITVRNLGPGPARFVLVGGETMDGPRYIWWNFVSSRRERISSRLRRSGRRVASTPCRATRRSSSRCPRMTRSSAIREVTMVSACCGFRADWHNH
jgi:redox-sensitive bicupin YhaK (pirin superfamily)